MGAAAASTPTASRMTTVTWSSKFTVAPDLAANRDPFYEWTGSFDLTTSRTAVPLDACSFYQVKGKFLANYDDDTTPAAAVPVPGTEDGSSWNRKSTSRPAREDTFGCGGDDDTSRVPRRKKPRRCFETNNNNDESFLAHKHSSHRHRHRHRFLRGYKRLASRCCFRTYIHTYMSYIYLFVQVHFTRTRSIPIHVGTRTLKNDSIDNQ